MGAEVPLGSVGEKVVGPADVGIGVVESGPKVGNLVNSGKKVGKNVGKSVKLRRLLLPLLFDFDELDDRPLFILIILTPPLRPYELELEPFPLPELRV